MRRRSKKSLAILKFTLLIMFILGIPVYMYFFHHDFITGFKSVDDVTVFLAKYEAASSFIYIGLQIAQVIISIIPAQFFNLASGYIFGFMYGYLLSIAGVTAGTAVTFFLARVLGKDAIYLLFGEKKITKYITDLNSRRALFIIFVIYLIPGLPKDLMGYAVGLSRIKFLPFLALSLIGRTPAMMTTIMAGSMLDKGNYTGVIALSVIAAVICISVFIFRKRILAGIDKGFKKI